MGRINIGIVTMWFERGAGYVSKLYRQALEQKHNVFIYARGGEYPKHDPNWADDCVTWGKKSNLPVATAINRQDFEKWIKGKQIEIVFFNEQHWWEPLAWCTELGLKIGAYIDYYTEETIPFFECYDFLICNTQRHFSAFSWHPYAYYVPWGTNLDLFKPLTYQLVRSDIITFFHSCGYSPIRKGTDFLLKAFSQMSEPAHLVIHTQTDLRQSLPQYADLILSLQKKQRLEIVHQTVTAPGLYYRGDIYVGPSRLEGIGLPLVEALACGLPLVTCDWPPMNEFVSPGVGSTIKIDRLWSRKDGYYWPQCQPDLQNLTYILEEYAVNFKKLPDLKRRARKYAEENLNWQDRVSQITNIFESSLSTARNNNQILQETLDFERRRQGMRYRFILKFPYIWNFYQKFLSV